MKKVVIGALATFLFLFLLGSVALASGYQDTYTGTTPHGGYSSTSDNCKTCHAVHAATGGGEVLLRSTVANACNYCHITTSISTKHPYGNNAANYTNDYRWNHSSIGYDGIENAGAKASFVNEETSTCTNCHSVHGANAIQIGTTYIAKKDPGAAGGPAVTTVNDENTFCANCHRRNHYSTSYNGAPPANYFGYSHIQGAANASYGNTSASYSGRVAGTASTDCSSCHQVGKATQSYTTPVQSFPHLTEVTNPSTNGGAWEFLDTSYYGLDAGISSTNQLDIVCLNCHTDSVTFGVGYTF